MIKKENISSQEVSWVKSNSKKLSKEPSIKNLYYPESIDELLKTIMSIRSEGDDFDLIGYSSNTLFLPTYKVKHLISTTKINKYIEADGCIICDCGVPIASLSKQMIDKGYMGFEGLTDLPGTIGAAVYGNCGCRGCSVNSLLNHIELLKEDGSIIHLTQNDLCLRYRSTSLKRGEINGVILRVFLNIVPGNVEELKKIAINNHEIRKKSQPSGFNNLGTTFNGGSKPTLKGYVVDLLKILIGLLVRSNDSRITFPKVLNFIGKEQFVPYVYYWNRYMFLDEKSHELFDEYFSFLRTLYKDVCFEIEIRK